MEGKIGSVNRSLALEQWRVLRSTFEDCGARVDLVDPVLSCEDMVFCANQTLVGLDRDGNRLCILSQMKHPSRQREVAAFAKWFSADGYQVRALPKIIGFEGSGDAIWHPGRALLWGGSGFRTEASVYTHLSEFFDVPVIRLPLRSDRFYHLDTCFCAINEETALVHSRSLTHEGLAMIRAVFSDVIECDDHEAAEGMACNACAIGGNAVVIQKGNPKTVSALRQRGFKVYEAETSEYLKSGGSVFCMKMYVF
ncbi:arginine deiminase-related protein [Bdellovibrionota bacterium FG-2]